MGSQMLASPDELPTLVTKKASSGRAKARLWLPRGKRRCGAQGVRGPDQLRMMAGEGPSPYTGRMDVFRLTRYFEDTPDLGVSSAYLFGSHAEGRAHQESDVDVAVLLDRKQYPSDRDRFEARVRLTSELISVLNANEVDVVILNDVPPLFGRRIVYEGKKLFLGDPEEDFAFTRDVQLQAADLAPWLERMRRIKLEALAR